MKNVFIRLMCLLLVLIMVMSVVSCAKDEEVETSADTVDTVESGPVSKVPKDIDFEGAEVNFIMPLLCEPEFVIEDATAELDKAIVDRNLQTEERLGIKFNYIIRDENTAGAYQNIIRNMIMAGEGGVDLIAGNAYYTATLASEGLFYDLNTEHEENYISSDIVWYNQSFVTNTAYKNKLYFAVGDVTLGATDRTPVIFFNEDELKTWQITDDIYSKALDGEWTIEYMKTLIKNVYGELDNVDGRTKGDFYGLFFNGGSMCIDAMMSAVGISVTKFDNDGNIKMAWSDGTAADGFEAIYNLMYNTDGVYLGTVSDKTYYGETTNYYSEQAFFEKRSLFSFGMLNAAKTFALDPTLHYGILPLPKLNEDQEYRTTPQDGFTVMALPNNLGSRLGLATATLETLSEYSYHTIRPVYYERSYKLRYASSENTAMLFETIIESISYNFGSFYSHPMGNPVTKLRDKLTGTGGAPSSSLKSVTAMFTKPTENLLNKLLQEFDRNG